MFYQEKTIDGVTYYRCTPNGEWRELQKQPTNYFGYIINPDLTIYKDGKRMFEAITCPDINEAKILIDAHIAAHEIVDTIFGRLPSLSLYELKSLLNK